MNKILLILIVVSIFTCKQNSTDSNTQETDQKEQLQPKDNFDWLIGEWERLNDEEGEKTYENWNKISVEEYSALGFTMKNLDTIFQEDIRLINVNGQWNVQVQMPGESDPVVFKVISHSSSEFICVNKENDFPHTIKYWMDGENMHATIANDEMEIPFEFVRKTQ